MANPILNLSASTPSYTEGDMPVILDSGITLTETDGDLIESAEIWIVGQPADGGLEFLSFTSFGGITGNYNAGLGRLMLTGSASVANYQNALNTVVYEHTGDNPTGASRSISFKVTDTNGEESTLQTVTLTLVAVNDAPTTGGDAASTVALGGFVALTSTDLSANDVDDTQDSLSFIVGTLPAHGALYLDDVELSSGDSFTKADLDNGLVTYVNDGVAGSVSDSFTVTAEDPDGAASAPATITLTVEQPAVLTVDTSLAYAENDSATAIDASLILTDLDSDIAGATVSLVGGAGTGETLAFTSGGGITGSFVGGVLTLSGTATAADYQTALRSVTYENTSDDPSASRDILITVTDSQSLDTTATVTVTITPSNDAPTTGGDNAATVALGDTVALTSTDLSASDVDDTQDSLSFIVGTLPAHGTLYLDDVELGSGDSFTKADLDNGLVNYVNDGVAGSVSDSFTVTAEDPDGAASAPATITLTVEQPAVLAVEPSLGYTENDSATAIDASLALTDLDSDIAGATVSLVGGAETGETLAFTPGGGITGSFVDGVLTLSGTATAADYQTALRSVTYENTSDDPAASRDILITVTDSQDLDTTATVTVTITAVNDDPAAGNNAGMTIEEGGVLTLASSDLSFTDVDNAADEIIYTLAELPVNGVLDLNGTTLALGDSFTQDDIDNGLVTYTHDGSETATDGFLFTIADIDGGSLPGNNSATISITPVDDAPELTAVASAGVTRNGTLQLKNRYLVNDVDSGSLEMTLVATNGTLSLTEMAGLSFVTGDGTDDGTLVFSGAIADINAVLAAITFKPTAGYTGSASIDLTADDGDLTDTATTLINVRPSTVGGGTTPPQPNPDTVTSGSTITLGETAHNAVLTGSADASVYGNGLDNDIQGNAGSNLLVGAGGDDSIRGAGGDDVVYGNEGRDHIYGNDGNDVLFGGQDDDGVYGGAEADAAYGNLANDVVYGNLADDSLYGGQGSDTLYGGQGDDLLFGNKGDDMLYAGQGDDTLTGGEGADSFVIQAGGHVTVTDFVAGEDVLSFLFDVADTVFVDDGNGNALFDDGTTQVLLIGVDASTEGLIPVG